jgi:hypothetical protein
MRPNPVLPFGLGLALGLVLGMAVGYTTPARGATTTEATLNVLRTNSAADVAADVSKAMRHASVVRLQEVETAGNVAGVRRALAGHPSWRATWRLPAGPFGDAILWDTRVWASAGRARALLVHRGVGGITPDRWLTWKPLRLRATGALVVVANVHAVSGYCSNRAERALRARLTRDYWATVARWTRRQLVGHPARVVLLGGDFNCQLSKRYEPWLPGRILAPLYRLDRAAGYDHLLTARTRGAPAAGRRWGLPAYSDHRLILRRLTFWDSTAAPTTF